MAIDCPGVVTRDKCDQFNSSRYTIGRVGYTGAPIPQAIVLHKLKNMSADAWNDQVTSPLPHFQCAVPTPSLCQEFPATPNPKSAHFLVTPTSTVQYVELSNTAFGIDYLLGSTWPGLLALQPITDVNGPFVHIVVDGECANNLLILLCCIGVALERSLPIIAASDLQIDRPELTLNPSIQTQVDDCVASGGFLNPPSVFELEDRVEALEECCQNNSSDIVVLKTDLQLLTNRVKVAENDIDALQAQVVDIYEKIAVIPSLVEAVTILQNLVADILKRCCPVKTVTECFRYQLQAGDEMLVTPNQCVWLNLPKKIEDRPVANCPNCCGPIVKPGPLWMADLACDTSCSDCQTWDLRATVRFRLAQWCAGKKASLYVVACGKKYLLAEKEITTTGTQSVVLTGEFLLPCGCTDVHLLVCSSDDKITPSKVVEFAEFRGCCAV